jgi:hypothetical protein
MRWWTMIGGCLIAGLSLFVGRLVYEKTLLTWTAGPQMVGFALMHRYPLMFVLGVASYVLAHIWVAAVLGIWMFKGTGTGSGLSRGLAVVGLLLLGASHVPEATLRLATVKCLGPGPQASSILIQAASQAELALTRVLVADGVDVNARSPLGDSPLLGAARGGSVEAVELLLGAGADIDVVGQFGETAVRGAAENGHVAVVRLLVQRGASLNVKGPGGLTALEVARANGHAEVVRVLVAGHAGGGETQPSP